METNRDFSALPEDCIEHVLSLTTPRDACVSALVSSTFQSAAESDFVWDRFLPSDYPVFLSRTVHPVQYASKRELYFQLCDHPVPIDGGRLRFGLEKSTVAMFFIIPVRELNMPGLNTLPPPRPRPYRRKGRLHRVWQLIPFSDSRFFEAAKFNCNCRPTLIFDYKIASTTLSSHTRYVSYLIFKLTESEDWKEINTIFGNVVIDGLNKCKQRVFLRLPLTESEKTNDKDSMGIDMKWPKQRADGCMEVEIGEFYNENLEDSEIEISLRVEEYYLGFGTLILGIELRLKEACIE